MSDDERTLDPLEPAGTPGESAGGFSDAGETGAQAPLPAAEPPAGSAAGTSAGDWSPAGSPATTYRTGGGSPPYGRDSTSDDRLMAALSWVCAAVLQIPLVSLVLLLAEGNKDRPFQRYHAVASIAFWLAAIVYEVLAAIVYTILGIVTLGCGLVCLWPIFFLPHLVALYYAYTAYMGRRPTIPLITDMMRGQGWA